MAEPLLYHEKQVAALCGVHCLNTLLQGPYFSEVDLAQIGQELDALERSFMAEGGMEGDAYRAYMAEGSGNVAEEGNFSIQVLAKALEVWGLSVTPLDSPNMASAAADPCSEAAFICNLEAHWFTVRKAVGGGGGGSWWNFNSLFPAPQPLSQFYLAAFLGTLRQQGYTIFVVRGGPLPPPQVPTAFAEEEGAAGRWFTPDQAAAANRDASDARARGRVTNALENALSAAEAGGGQLTLRPRGSTQQRAGGFGGGGAGSGDGMGGMQLDGDDGDADLAAAIAASLGGGGDGAAASGGAAAGGGGGARPASSFAAAASGNSGLDDDADADLAAAIAASLADAAAAGAGPSSSAAASAGGGATSSSTAAAGAAATAAAPELAPLGPEPEEGAPGTVTLAFRLPTGSRVSRRFRLDDRTAALYTYLSRDHGLDVRRHALATAFPRKTVSCDAEKSLADVGLTQTQMLNVEPAAAAAAAAP